MQVFPNDINEYRVVDCDCEFKVHLAHRTCDCRKWDLDQFPCPHACAVISQYGISVYGYISNFYLKSELAATYNATIHSVGNQRDWLPLVEADKEKILPPTAKRGVGRPKKQRIPSAGEPKKVLQCSRCKEFGHFRKTCKNHISYESNGQQKKK